MTIFEELSHMDIEIGIFQWKVDNYVIQVSVPVLVEIENLLLRSIFNWICN